jgi:hypothetical protein
MASHAQSSAGSGAAAIGAVDRPLSRLVDSLLASDSRVFRSGDPGPQTGGVGSAGASLSVDDPLEGMDSPLGKVGLDIFGILKRVRNECPVPVSVLANFNEDGAAGAEDLASISSPSAWTVVVPEIAPWSEHATPIFMPAQARLVVVPFATKRGAAPPSCLAACPAPPRLSPSASETRPKGEADDMDWEMSIAAQEPELSAPEEPFTSKRSGGAHYGRLGASATLVYPPPKWRTAVVEGTEGTPLSVGGGALSMRARKEAGHSLPARRKGRGDDTRRAPGKQSRAAAD